jgi:hypothetical protein
MAIKTQEFRSPTALRNDFPSEDTIQSPSALATTPAPSTAAPAAQTATAAQPAEKPRARTVGFTDRAGIAAMNAADTGGVQASLKKGADYATEFIGSQAQANANMAANDYTQKIEEWKAQGKYWFDPNANLMPDLQSYLQEMPSAKDAMAGTTMTGEMLGQDTTASNAALGVMSLGISGAFDDKQQAAHILSKSGERAVEGAGMGGWVGAIVGGVVGIVEGAFGWAEADKQDKEARKAAVAEYDRKMKEWTYLRNKRLLDQKNQYEAARRGARVAKRESDKQEKETANTKKANAITQRRQQMIEALTSAGRIGQTERQQRIARWN